MDSSAHWQRFKCTSRSHIHTPTHARAHTHTHVHFLTHVHLSWTQSFDVTKIAEQLHVKISFCFRLLHRLMHFKFIYVLCIESLCFACSCSFRLWREACPLWGRCFRSFLKPLIDQIIAIRMLKCTGFLNLDIYMSLWAQNLAARLVLQWVEVWSKHHSLLVLTVPGANNTVCWSKH